MDRSVRTRLYFTSESHLHSILNVLKYPRNPERCAFSASGLSLLDEVRELSYLTQVVIRLYKSKDNPGKMRAEIYFSPGAVNDPTTGLGRSALLAPYVLLNGDIDYEDLIGCLDDAINASDERLGSEDDLLASPVTRERANSKPPLSAGRAGRAASSGDLCAVGDPAGPPTPQSGVSLSPNHSISRTYSRLKV